MNAVTRAAVLDDAARAATAVDQSPDEPDLDAAYAIQDALIDRRLGRGERLVGVKLGFTSAAKMLQMGVSEVIVGQLTTGMLVSDGGTLDVTALIHPRVEPEVAFRVAVDVDPDAIPATWRTAVDAIAPALEVIDSRYRDFRFSLGDVIADNTSAAAFVVGDWAPIADIANLGVLLEIDGAVVETGSTAAILGHPMRAVDRALALAGRLGIELRAGNVILAGAATAAVALPAGVSVRAVVATLGRASLHTVGAR